MTFYRGLEKMSLKPFVAVFTLILLSGCQPITQTSANANDLVEEERVSTEVNAKQSQSGKNIKKNTDLQSETGVISNTPLKLAVDVEQIDSLMVVDEASDKNTSPEILTLTSASLLAEKGAKDNNENVDLGVSTDAITLRLLDLGAAALANQKLLTPEDDNANLYFQAALGREPDNTQAQAGLDEIIHFYTAWALDKAKQGQNTSARKYLAAASFVDIKNPLIQETKKQIKDWRAGIRPKVRATKLAKKKTKAVQNTFYLPQDLFSLSEALVIQKLQPIIDRIEKDQLNIEIFWPNDKEARLLYRIINSRTEDFRVRGMIYRRAQHMIEVKQG